jgi:hypothetical protein
MTNTFFSTAGHSVAGGYTEISSPAGAGAGFVVQGTPYALAPDPGFGDADLAFGAGISTVADLAKFIVMELSVNDASAKDKYPVTTSDLILSQHDLIPGMPTPSPDDPYLPLAGQPPATAPTVMKEGPVGAAWYFASEPGFGNVAGMRGAIPGYTAPLAFSTDLGIGAVLFLAAQPDSASGLVNGKDAEGSMWSALKNAGGAGVKAPVGSWANQPLPSGVERVLEVMNGPALTMPLKQALNLPHLSGMGLTNVSDWQAFLGPCTSFTVERIVSDTSAWVTLLCSKRNTSFELAVAPTAGHPITVLKNITTLTKPLGGEGLQAGVALVSNTAGNVIPVATSNADGSFDVSNKAEISGVAGFATFVGEGAVPVAGDFDGDGVGDIALTGVLGWNTIPVAFANGDASFNGTNGQVSGYSVFPTTASGAGVQRVPGDFNGDGYADIALAGGAGWNTIPVAFSNGDGTFLGTNLQVTTGNPSAQFANYAASAAPGSIVTGDFNADGLTDIAIPHTGSLLTFMPVAVSNGDGTFSGWTATFGTDTSFLALAQKVGITPITSDYNGDGRADIALVGLDQITLAFSNGDGTFVVSSCNVVSSILASLTASAQRQFDFR